MPLNPSSARTLAARRWLPWLLGALALAPLFWCWSDFRDLFWFGDEWDQLDQISQMGFGRWVLWCFGENFAPAFKLSWGTIALSAHGSYFAIVAAVWGVHAVAMVVLARWLLRAGFSPFSTAVAVLVAALSATNVETLGWTIQLITVQGMLFFIAAAAWQLRCDLEHRWSAPTVAVFALLIIVSTFSFVRGALTGLSLGAVLVLSLLRREERKGWRGRLGLVAVCIVPAIVSIWVIMRFAPGNQQHLSSLGWREPALFAAGYFFLNPFYDFTGSFDWTPRTIVVFGVIKTAVLAWGWWKATPTQRRVLLPLLVFDLGNAVLMGIGRYNQGLLTATSSRYQYISLVATLPFVAVILEHLVAALPRSRPLRLSFCALLTVTACSVALHDWPRSIHDWSGWRGRDTRKLVFQNPNPPAEGAIPGIPFLTTARAKQLVVEYHLH